MVKKGSLVVHLGGPEVHRHLRARAGDSDDGSLVHSYIDSTIAPMLNQWRRLKSVLDVIQGVRASGFSLFREE